MKRVAAEMTGVPIPAVRQRSAFADYVALTKPRLNFLVVLTSAAGYYLGTPTAPEILPMASAVCGTALVAGGSAVLNQVYERQTDALMRRTRQRPLPDGRVSARDASVYGVAISLIGLMMLWVWGNALTAWLALATTIIYVVVYTPMKRRSPVSTLVGAVPGALPPLIGWTAAHGSIALGGWTLFLILFLWQVPHFMAIAWMYREDYGRAGFPMLPVVEPDGHRTARQAVLYSAALLPLSLLPSLVGICGFLYFWIALVVGAGLLILSIRFSRERSDRAARELFFGSIVYLPIILAAMVLAH
jgi:protoheme IX farnesyltransferase